MADRVVGRKGLTRRMRAATFALAETLFTTGEGPPPPARLQWLCDDLDDFAAQSGARARLVYRACLLAISAIAPLLVLRPLPFRFLSFEKRVHALERMERSPFGLAVFGAKAVLCILYYEHPEAAALIGYDATCLNETPEAQEAAG